MNYEMSGVNFEVRSQTLTTLFTVHIATQISPVF